MNELTSNDRLANTFNSVCRWISLWLLLVCLRVLWE